MAGHCLKTAICLLTADRADLTAKTVSTFLDHNPDHDFILLHADDASRDDENMNIASRGGFETVYRYEAEKRLGQIPALCSMWSEAARRGAQWILHLENDQEFVGSVPDRRDADQIRLYGEYKAKPGSPRARSGDRIWGSGERACWKFDSEGWERAVIHWGAQPSITRTELLLGAVAKAAKVHDIAANLKRLDTLRPVQNITWHTDPGGTTPGHWLGKDVRC